MQDIKPIEETDPEFAELIKRVVAKQIPAFVDGSRVFSKITGKEVRLERNERCPCESGLKWKKCCGQSDI
jgi:uncharacterized protein YchJ